MGRDRYEIREVRIYLGESALASAILPPGVVYHPGDIKANQVKFPGYNVHPVPVCAARPSAGGDHSGPILVHGVHGVHGYEEHMKDWPAG